MLKKLFLPLLLLLSVNVLLAQKSEFTSQQKIDFKNIDLDKKITSYQVFEFNTDALEDYVRQENGDVEFSLRLSDDLSWNLDLLNTGLYADNYLLRTASKTILNKRRPIPMQGYVANANENRVALTVSENFIYGFIEDGNTTYYIEPLSYVVPNEAENLFIIYKEANVVKDNTTKCAVTERHHRGKSLQHEEHAHEHNERSTILACYMLELAIATDYQMFQSYGSVAAVEAHNVGVMNTVATDYDDSFNDEIQFQIVEQYVPTTSASDPFPTATDIETMLNFFSSWAPNNFNNQHDLGQHWSSRDYDGTTIGLAWVGSVCSASYRYHALQDFSSTAWALRVLTSHEMGHNFNQSHDNSGDPYIMAPAVNNTATWSPTSIAGFNSYIPTLSCLSACPPDLAPVAAFSAENNLVCTGSYVRFSDQSTESPTSWNWTFQGGTPSSSSAQNPTVQYNSPGTYTVSLTASNNIGSNTSTQNGYITVGSNGTSMFFYEDFENGQGAWTIENPDNGTTWTQATVQGARYGNQAMFMDHFNYNSTGQRDRLVSPTIDFSGRTDASLNIEYAYAAYNTQFSDSLIVSISLNNGNSWFRVFSSGENGSGSLATVPTESTLFTPGTESDWCFASTFGNGCINVDLSGYSSATTKVRIESYNGFGNSMYIENVSLVSSCATFTPPTANFIMLPPQGCAPLTVQYTDLSTGSPTSWNWSFPNGTPSTSTEQNPTVVYAQPGTYSATLTASNSTGTGVYTANNAISVEASPIANFTVNVNGNTVTCVNNSDNATSYLWDFGNGSTDVSANPTYTYPQEGTYTISLTASNACGNNTAIQTIVLESAPVAAFFTNTPSGCAPHAVSFNNQSTGANLNYSWTFQGGSPATSSQENPLVIYGQSGVFPVSLTVTNSSGTDTQTQNAYIIVNQTPTANFSFTTNDLIANFVNGSSTDATNFNWNFGDNSTSSQMNPSHTYTNAGTYNVVLFAQNECGSNTFSQQVVVTEPLTAPTAAFSATETTGCTPSFTTTFINESSANAVSYSWQFTGGSPNTSTSVNPTVTYNAPGVYPVTLTAYNEAGENTAEELNYIIVNPAPEAAFQAQTNGFTTLCGNESLYGNNYFWDFGDNTISEEVSPTHIYNQEGTYTITLTTTNECGSSTASQTVSIETVPNANFSANTNFGCTSLNVNFTPEYVNPAAIYNWQFNGGAPAFSNQMIPNVQYNMPGVYPVTLTVTNSTGTDTQTIGGFITVDDVPNLSFSFNTNELTATFNANIGSANSVEWNFGDNATSSETNPSHTYTQEGTYNVTLTATNDCGTNTYEQTVNVSLTPTPPTANFTADVVEGCAPLTVQFTSLASGNTESLVWNFQGGTPNFSNDANPVITFPDAGSYQVSLTAINDAGENIAIEDNYITVLPSVFADFDIIANELMVNLSNTSSGATSFTWSFGDGNTSSEANPSHTYAQEGNYLITLTAQGECGTESIEQIVNISLTPTPPTADFAANVVEGCAPLTVQFTNLSSDNTNNLVWNFQGGEPAFSTEQNPVVTFADAGSYQVVLTAYNETGEDIALRDNYITVLPNVVSNFSVSANELTINLTNNSLNADFFFWDFGDGNTSNEAEPSHTYQQEGTYTISLIAQGECGTQTTVETINVSLTPMLPIAGFSADVIDGCAPLTVQFTSLASDNTESLVWNFEGGEPASSTEQNPVVTFANAGSYEITLTASNQSGQDVASQPGFITVAPNLNADFSVSTNQLSVSLNNTSANASSFSWNFGDGTVSNENEPNHTYEQEGTYIITLTAEGECGSQTIEQTVTVSLAQVPPTANFTADIVEGCAPLTVQFTSLASDNTESLVWNFQGGEPAFSNEPNPVVTFANTGSYQVVLTAYNDAGENISLQDNYITVLPSVFADFSVSTNESMVSLSNSSANASSYSWSFGDGTTSDEISPNHTYEQAGSYVITLTAQGECGTQTIEQTVTVSLNQVPPVANFMANIVEGCEALTVQFTSLASDNTENIAWNFEGGEPTFSNELNPIVTFADAGSYDVSLTAYNSAGEDIANVENYVTVLAQPLADFIITYSDLTINGINNSEYGATYLWDFGDGVTSSAFEPTHVYTESGTYLITLTTMNQCGEAVQTQEVTVNSINVSIPIASFDLSTTSGCTPLIVETQNTSSNNPTEYLWEVSGPSTSTSNTVNSSFVLDTPGTYTISLTVTNEAGTNTVTQTDVITVYDMPEAAFFINNNTGNTIYFFNEAGTNDYYLWDFGDGNTATTENPIHTYEQNGTYPVTFTITNECGTSTITQEVYTGEAIPICDFYADIESGCTPFVVQFFDESQNNPTQWSWTFEGGTPATSNEQNPIVTFENAGIFDITLQVNNSTGGNSLQRSMYIEATNAPSPNFDWSAEGLVTSFTNMTMEDADFEWDFGDGTTLNAVAPSHLYDSDGTYLVTLTATNECGSETYGTEISVVGTGIEQIDFLSSFEIFPNPNNGLFTLTLEGISQDDLEIRLVNVLGQVISYEKLDFAGTLRHDYDYQSMPTGVYILELRVGNKNMYKKIIVE